MRPSFWEMNVSPLSLGRVAVRYPGAHEPKMPNVSKYRATKPRIEDADVHVRWVKSCPEAASELSPVHLSTAEVARTRCMARPARQERRGSARSSPGSGRSSRQPSRFCCLINRTWFSVHTGPSSDRPSTQTAPVRPRVGPFCHRSICRQCDKILTAGSHRNSAPGPYPPPVGRSASLHRRRCARGSGRNQVRPNACHSRRSHVRATAP